MKVLLVELWGLGDATLLTTVLRPFLEAGASVTLLCRPATAELLRPSYPGIEFIFFDAPWTAFQGKYRLHQWPWRKIAELIRACRRGKFDLAASVRNDPRDHLLLFLTGARKRIGFPKKGSGFFLTRRVVSPPEAHRVEQWRQIGEALADDFPAPRPDFAHAAPFLDAGAYGSFFLAGHASPSATGRRPVVGLHCGARIRVRRWPEESFARTVDLLRGEADFHLALFPDPDGYGRALSPRADSCHEELSIPQLAAGLAACDLVLCNDSGPGHIAAALGKPVVAIFGPMKPEWFRPYGEKNHVVVRDICPFRPCFDYCHFHEPICLTELLPDAVWPEIRDWFRRQWGNLQALPASR